MNARQRLFAFLSLLLLSAGRASADTGWKLPPPPTGLPNQDFGTMVIAIINWMLGFIILLAILVIIWGGTVYIASSGDQQRIGQAKSSIKYALMGLIIAGLAYGIVNVVVTTLTAAGR